MHTHTHALSLTHTHTHARKHYITDAAHRNHTQSSHIQRGQHQSFSHSLSPPLSLAYTHMTPHRHGKHTHFSRIQRGQRSVSFSYIHTHAHTHSLSLSHTRTHHITVAAHGKHTHFSRIQRRQRSVSFSLSSSPSFSRAHTHGATQTWRTASIRAFHVSKGDRDQSRVATTTRRVAGIRRPRFWLPACAGVCV